MALVKKVFLIDDDEINNFICVNILKKISFAEDVQAFESATDALEAIQALDINDASAFPEVIFLDINMPIMNGWDFLKEFSKIKSNLPIDISLFMLSSSIYQADVEKSREYEEVVDFVTKPLNESVLNEIKEKHFN